MCCYHVTTKVDSTCLRRRRLTVSTRYAYGSVKFVLDILLFFFSRPQWEYYYILWLHTNYVPTTYGWYQRCDVHDRVLGDKQCAPTWATTRIVCCTADNRYAIHLLNRPYYYYIILYDLRASTWAIINLCVFLYYNIQLIIAITIIVEYNTIVVVVIVLLLYCEPIA